MNPVKHTENLTIAWCRVILEAVRHSGARFVFISPGYRDAPFVAALKIFPDLTVVSCMDERSAAFQALGAAKDSGLASVLICTSGTAVANYLPAILEAGAEQIPLIVLSSDRPMELTYGGANQTINQNHILGQSVKEFLPLPSPEDKLRPEALYGMVRESIERALFYPRGTVHINVPLRAPLEPIAVESERLEQFNQFDPSLGPFSPSIEISPDSRTQASVREFIEGAERGVLVIGRLDQGSDLDAILGFAEKLSWPVYCDVTSSIKGRLKSLVDPELPFMKEWLQDYRPDAILHIGRRLVSKYWDSFLESRPDLRYLIVSSSYSRQDPSYTSNYQIKTESFSWLEGLNIKGKAEEPHLLEEKSKMFSLIEVGEDLHFPYLARQLLKAYPHGNFFLGNSSAIRSFDTWEIDGHLGRIESNRGVSGIEGLLSTVIGLELASQEVWNLVIGDVSFIHDLNSLYQLAQLNSRIRVFLVNNKGGQIFRKLPIGQHQDILDPMITTPHSFNFEGVALSAGIPYEKAENREQLNHLLAGCPAPALVEVCIDGDSDLQVYEAIKKIQYTGGVES